MAAEVIQPWGDAIGDEWTFVRGKLEQHINALTAGEHPAVLPADIFKKLQGGAAAVPTFSGKLKKEDVDFLVSPAEVGNGVQA